MREALWSLGAGLLFAAGLALSGMTQPSKVSGFLDVGGAWDPSLALVMAGAVSVYLVANRWARRRSPGGAPLLGGRLPALATGPIDLRLLGGAALFGVGWGLSGFCPGPALVSAGAGSLDALWFVPAMVAGVALHRVLTAPRRIAVRQRTGHSAARALSAVGSDGTAEVSSCG